MHWSDKAIITSVQKYGENNGIATLLTYQHGIFKGMVRNISSKKQRGIYQIGNHVEAQWRGRLSEHLGSFSCELNQSNASFTMHDTKRLAALSSICALFDKTLHEREPQPGLFSHLETFLEHLKDDNLWEVYYVFLELELLNKLGFGLDLDKCAATGISDNLIYVSPRSGCAVSAEAGEPYKNKLLKLPFFLKNSQNCNINDIEINNGLALCGYFINKYIFEPHNHKMPIARLRFADIMKALENNKEVLEAV